MTALPKPTKRKKTRKPLKRMRVRKPRRVSARKATLKQCDIAWSKLIRKPGKCFLAGTAGHTCKGPLQAAHGFSRRYYATRHETWNGFPLCAGAHMKHTHDPLRWEEFLLRQWGRRLYEARKKKALEIGGHRDYNAILARLKGEGAE